MKRFVPVILGALLAIFATSALAAFSITETIPGFRPILGKYSPKKGYGVAAQAYTVGEPLILNANTRLLDAAVNGSADIVGVSLEAKTLPAATSTDDDHLLLYVSAEDAIFEVNFDAASWLDDAAAALIAADGTSIAFTANLTYGNAAVDSSVRGHAIVCYAGPCKGEWRIITAYDAAGGATGDQMVTLNRPFSVLPTTSAYFIILGTGTDTQGVVPGRPCDLGTTSASNVLGNDISGSCIVESLERAWQGVLHVRFTNTIYQAP